MSEKKTPKTSMIASHLMKMYKSISYSVAMKVAADVIHHRNGVNMSIKTAFKTAEYLTKRYVKATAAEKQKMSKAKEKSYRKRKRTKKETTSDKHEFLIWVAEQQESEFDIDKSSDKEYEAGKVVAGWLNAIEQSYTRDLSDYAIQNRELILEIIYVAKANGMSNYGIYKAVKAVFLNAEETLAKLANSIYDEDYGRDGKMKGKGFKRDVEKLIKSLGIRTTIRNKWW